MSESNERLRRALLSGAAVMALLSAVQVAKAAYDPMVLVSQCSEEYCHCWEQAAMECVAAYCALGSTNGKGTCGTYSLEINEDGWHAYDISCGGDGAPAEFQACLTAGSSYYYNSMC